jgi:hypothetical protein
VVAALDAFEALCEPAAGGDLAAVDWEAVEAPLKEARKTLAAARRALQPLPPRWDELKSRVDSAERLAHVLTSASSRIGAGRAVEAIPALQAHAAADPHPFVTAALERLVRVAAGDTADAAREWQARAVDALERGELATAAAYLDLARSFTVAAPYAVPEIRRVERQIVLLTEARDATRAGRAALARGDHRAALAAYRAALEIAAEGESGLPPGARRALHAVLEAEDAGDATDAPDSLLGDDSHPLTREFVAPALARWLRLARQASALRQVETQVALGRHAAAAEVAADLAEAYPRDPQMVDAFRLADAGAAERRLMRLRRRLARARRLADQGAYAEALVEIAPPAFEDEPELAGDEGEALADQAADLRLSLERLAQLAGELKPLLEQMRDAALTGQYDAALAARLQAEFLDPGRRASALWADIDGLAALIETRRSQRPAQSAPAPPAAPPPLAAEVAPPAPPKVPPLQSEPVEPLAAPPVTRPVESPAAELPAPADVHPPVPTEPPVARDIEESPAPDEPPAPFDLDDWLSNVTDLGPEGGAPENGS